MREASLEMADETATRAVETQQNWLARFLHIKPVTQALCFRVGRGRARQEIVRLLRDWRRYGIQDISFSRETNVIAARVDKSNCKFPSYYPLLASRDFLSIAAFSSTCS